MNSRIPNWTPATGQYVVERETRIVYLLGSSFDEDAYFWATDMPKGRQHNVPVARLLTEYRPAFDGEEPNEPVWRHLAEDEMQGMLAYARKQARIEKVKALAQAFREKSLS